jgi:beta-phosphoglucomutase-like phosphatase (HAD superfamily)
MIRGIIFDLDGTLVQTEFLKASSYASAAVELSHNTVSETEVMEVYKEVVGLSRQEVAQKLLKRFELEGLATGKMSEFHVATPWQAFAQMRMIAYQLLLDDPKILHDNICPYNVGLLRWAKKRGYLTGLATMSHCSEASRVLQILNLNKELDFIATMDDIENAKPDPEIYLMAVRELNISQSECLVIEDSVAGIKAALSAGTWCIAVTSVFTREAVHDSGILNEQWIVDDPVRLEHVAKKMIAEKETKTKRS